MSEHTSGLTVFCLEPPGLREAHNYYAGPDLNCHRYDKILRTTFAPLSMSGPTEAPIDISGRSALVLSLRRRYPRFWKSLNELWRGRDISAFDAWCSKTGVVDSWLREVCLSTLAAWEADPNGPNAQLTEGYPWYSTADFGTPALVDFSPSFDDPYPKYSSSFGAAPELAARLHSTSGSNVRAIIEAMKIETVEDFEKRMRSQFEKQLRAYSKLVRASFNYESRPQAHLHAEWTALVFGGVSVGVISQDETTSAYSPDEETVRKAVSRFASRIGLTLRGN
jgi:hypothetical protein